MSPKNVEVVHRAVEALNERDVVEEDEMLDLGDRVVFVGRVDARGRTSGVELDRTWGCVFQFRDGRVFRADGYTHPREALEAAGRPS